MRRGGFVTGRRWGRTKTADTLPLSVVPRGQDVAFTDERADIHSED